MSYREKIQAQFRNRQEKILQYLQENGISSTKTIAIALQLSIGTVRGDLASLHRHQLVSRSVRFVGNSRTFFWSTLTDNNVGVPREEIRQSLTKLTPLQLENVIFNFADYGLTNEHLEAIVRASIKVLGESV